ncbi:MAG: hypothetical protein VKK04_17110 [Synechococcales bacterium]|nr:hypothetical protein [Synechococcales bacterium]
MKISQLKVFQFVRPCVLALGRLMVVGVMVTALWLGAMGNVVHAAATPEAEAYEPDTSKTEPYENGPVRPSYNLLSKENFQGGVDRTAIEESGRVSEEQPERDGGIIDTIKDILPGSSADESPRSDFKAEKNPTLKRYTTEAP